MNRQDRRPAFKRTVFAADLPDSVKVLLLRLLEDMNAKLIVSVPRSKLAEDLGVAFPRISERTKVARDLGYLSQVRRGRPGVTAVYQGLTPNRGTGSVPLDLAQLGTPSSTCLGTEPVPNTGGLEVRPDHTQVGIASGERKGPLYSLPQRGIDEEPCRWHRHDDCPADCADHPLNREATA